ncbi:MAG: hypothetical protein RIG63_12410 [Coleofasciculus chthonoplastes F3-SA18-01]
MQPRKQKSILSQGGFSYIWVRSKTIVVKPAPTWLGRVLPKRYHQQRQEIP